MPGTELSTLYLQLGVAGATLLILFTTIAYLFKFMNNVSETKKKEEEDQIKVLCNKIDQLIGIIAEDRKIQAETRIANEKDQKTMVNLISDILKMTSIIYEKVMKIDLMMKWKEEGKDANI